MACFAAVYGVKHHGSVGLDAHGGPGLTAVGAVAPGGGVGHHAVPDHDVSHAAGPLGGGQGRVLAGGGQRDLVSHLECHVGVSPVGRVGGGEDVLVRSDGDGLVGEDQLGHLQGQAGVDRKLRDLPGIRVGGRLHAHIPARALAPGGHGGEILVEEKNIVCLRAGLVEVGGDHSELGVMVIQGDGHLGPVHNGRLAVGEDQGVLPVVAGLIDPVLDHQADGHAGGHDEEIGVYAAQHPPALGLREGDGPVDIAVAVDGGIPLNQHGGDGAVRGQLQGVALHPASAVDGDGVAVGQAVHKLGDGL